MTLDVTLSSYTVYQATHCNAEVFIFKSSETTIESLLSQYSMKLAGNQA